MYNTQYIYIYLSKYNTCVYVNMIYNYEDYIYIYIILLSSGYEGAKERLEYLYFLYIPFYIYWMGSQGLTKGVPFF